MLGAEKQILRWESLPAKKYHLFFWDAVVDVITIPKRFLLVDHGCPWLQSFWWIFLVVWVDTR